MATQIHPVETARPMMRARIVLAQPRHEIKGRRVAPHPLRKAVKAAERVVGVCVVVEAAHETVYP
jgi:hypothetical protein